jgi:glycosyltransferase involved in cell wall biosynthesis
MSVAYTTSVIVPAYNAEATIADCISRILSLDPAPLEVLVINDGSLDNTSVVANQYQVKVIDLEKNVGAAAARNIGASIANGQFFAFLDADCMPDNNWLGNFLERWDSNRYSGLTGPYSRPGDSRYLTVLTHRLLDFNQPRFSQVVVSSTSSNFFTTRSNFKKAGGFPVYTLPWSSKSCYVNEDAELAYFLTKNTGKPLLWIKENGVAHYHRNTLKELFRQQFIWTESILLSYARFPEMLTSGVHYSRTHGAITVLSCILFYFSLAFFLAGAGLGYLLGLIPFFLANFPVSKYLVESKIGAGIVPCFCFILFVSSAWSLGIISGTIKAVPAYFYWKFSGARKTLC